MNSLKKVGVEIHDQIRILEEEIAFLEGELSLAETKLNSFETQIRAQLNEEIHLVNNLTALYKKLQRAKKDKRLEQKRKGKNFKERIVDLNPKSRPSRSVDMVVQLSQGQELKRLYREAMLMVHPDKFAHDIHNQNKATELTTQLIEIYQSGDLEELRSFHEYIVSGIAMTYGNNKPEMVTKPETLIDFLQKRKVELLYTLEIIKSSYTFQVLETYPNPLSFIEELRIQFQYRIVQLKKRTRKA